MIISPDQQSVSRQPRAIVIINDILVKWVSLTVTTTTFYIADNFNITIPYDQNVDDLTSDYWASSPQFLVKIYIGFPPNPEFFTTQDLELMIQGEADEMEFDPLSRTINFVGRDLTAKLIDNKTTDKFTNLTSSQVATQLAVARGLTPVVTETKTKVGVYYNADQTLLSEQSTEWDIITGLAQQEGFVAYIEQDKLIFKPEPTEQDVPYILNYVAPNLLNQSPLFPGLHLAFTRSMTLAQDVSVTVRVPSSPSSKKAFNVTVTSGVKRQRPHVKGLPKASGKKQKYVRVIPGLSREQALQRAQQILRNISVHEINLIAQMPGDNSLKKDTMIKLTGTNSAFDQFYFADHVVRHMSIDEGYDMEINAKNHSVDSQVIV